MKDHIHDRNEEGERLLLLAKEGALLERYSYDSQRKPADPQDTVVNSLANFGMYDLHNGANERARRVILAAVTTRIAHILDLGFVEMRKLMLFGLRAKP